MIETFLFTNLVGDTFEFNTDSVPLQKIEVEVDTRSADIEKMQQHGNWPTYTYMGKMLIHTEGQILAADSTAYNAIKFELLRVLMPDPLLPVTDRKLGFLTVEYTGATEELLGDCTIDGWPSMPMVGGYSAMSDLQLTWKLFQPYMIGASTGNPYWIG